MTPHQLLRYHLVLLVAANGKQQVLATLADVLRLSPEELDTTLGAVKTLDAAGEKPPKGTRPRDPIDAVVKRHPDKAEALMKLNARFTNKAFLPELRDIRRFLDDHSQPFKTLKSRSDALPKVLNVLAQLDLRELRRLCEQPDSREYSALGIISDEIMGRGRK